MNHPHRASLYYNKIVHLPSAGGNDWALAFVTGSEQPHGHYTLRLAHGNNGDQTSSIREGDFGDCFNAHVLVKKKTTKLSTANIKNQAKPRE